MNSPAAGPRHVAAPAAHPRLDPAELAGTNINPVTGLASDYLNHFNEAIMLLEMLPSSPECKADFVAWRPMSYHEHFAASSFHYRELAIAAYDAADPAICRRLDGIADRMNVILNTIREGMERNLSLRTTKALAMHGARWLKPLVAHAGAVINGHMLAADNAADGPQAAVDALFEC